MNRIISHYDDNDVGISLVIRFYNREGNIILENLDAQYCPNEGSNIIIDGEDYNIESVKHYVEFNIIEVFLED